MAVCFTVALTHTVARCEVGRRSVWQTNVCVCRCKVQVFFLSTPLWVSQHIACICVYIAVSKWDDRDASCNYKPKQACRPFVRTSDSTSPPWRSHFVRNFKSQILLETTRPVKRREEARWPVWCGKNCVGLLCKTLLYLQTDRRLQTFLVHISIACTDVCKNHTHTVWLRWRGDVVSVSESVDMINTCSTTGWWWNWHSSQNYRLFSIN